MRISRNNREIMITEPAALIRVASLGSGEMALEAMLETLAGAGAEKAIGVRAGEAITARHGAGEAMMISVQTLRTATVG